MVKIQDKTFIISALHCSLPLLQPPGR